MLHQVRVYTGQPDSTKQPKAYGAHMRQIGAWRAAGVRVLAHPLRYPANFPAALPQEKGVDVKLAIDFVLGAIDGEYDVGVVFSTDTDLRPALEMVANRFAAHPKPELAAWSSDVSRRRIPTRANRQLWCHYLSWDDYTTVSDPTSYVVGR